MAMLTKVQRARFEEIKKSIESNIVKIGDGLYEIQRDCLYLDDYATFEEFVRKEYGMGASNAHSLIRFRHIAARLSNTSSTPSTHRVFRVLNNVEEDKQRDVWCAALDKFNGKPSESQLKSVAKEMGAIKPAKPRKPKPEKPAQPQTVEASSVKDITPKKSEPTPDTFTPSSETLEEVNKETPIIARPQTPAGVPVVKEAAKIEAPKVAIAEQMKAMASRLSAVETEEVIMELLKRATPEVRGRVMTTLADDLTVSVQDKECVVEHIIDGVKEIAKHVAAKLRKNNKKLIEKEVLDAAERFYREYPRRIGKAKAIEEFARAVARSSDEHPPEGDSWIEFIIGRAKLFAKSMKDKDPNYIPHPSTWLSQGRFMDDVSAWKGKKTFRDEMDEMKYAKAEDF